jgi:hypothetical protein
MLPTGSEVERWSFILEAVQTKEAPAVPLINPLMGDRITAHEV